MMDINQIREYLPHRYPFLLVDRVVEMDLEAKQISAYKNVTINEPFFDGHFPQHPIMPGVLIIEAMAQAAGILGFNMMGVKPADGVLYFFVGSDKSHGKWSGDSQWCGSFQQGNYHVSRCGRHYL